MSRFMLLTALGLVLVTRIDSQAEPQSTSSCIALTPPTLQDVQGDGTDLAEAVRGQLMSRLTESGIELIPVATRAAVEDAREHQCAYVLFITLTLKGDDGRGGLGKFLGDVASAAGTQVAPAGGAVGGAVVRVATSAGAEAVARLATSTKARDEMRLQYRLEAVAGGSRVGPSTVKVKARADGEDLLTPVVDKASTAIVAATRGRS